VGLADEDERLALVVHAAERTGRAAPLVLDQSPDDDVGSRCHVALEPIARARARQVRAVAALRDDPLEPVFVDHFEERLSVLLEMLGDRDRAAPAPGPGPA